MYRLAGPDVANALESLATLSFPRRRQVDPERSERMRQLRTARTCYDHLAGAIGVDLHNALIDSGFVKPEHPKQYVLTAKGQKLLSELGGSGEWRARRTPFARACLDWSERKPHLAGRLATLLLDRFFKDGWIVRVRESRAVRITERGLRGFEKEFGVTQQVTPA